MSDSLFPQVECKMKWMGSGKLYISRDIGAMYRKIIRQVDTPKDAEFNHWWKQE